jgi:hypothetical protein
MPIPSIINAERKNMRTVIIFADAKAEKPNTLTPIKNKIIIDNKPKKDPNIAYAIIIVYIFVGVIIIDSRVPIIISFLKEKDVEFKIFHRKPHPIEPIRIKEMKSPPYDSKAASFSIENMLPNSTKLKKAKIIFIKVVIKAILYV